MLQALKSMLGSKKAIVMVVGLLVSIGGKYGLEIPTEELTAVLSPLLFFFRNLSDFSLPLL